MSRRPLLALPGLAVAAGGMLLLSMTSDPGRQDGTDDALPSVAEATELLDAQVGRLRAMPTREGYCGENTFCPNAWAQAGGDAAVPTTAPHVLRIWTTGEQRILTVCGRDGRSRAYRSDFVVERVKGELQAPFIVFWRDLIYRGYRPDGGAVIVSDDPNYVPPEKSNPPECE